MTTKYSINEMLVILDKEMEEIAGSWNGEDPGRGEEMAGTAIEIQEKIKELKELINYLNE